MDNLSSHTQKALTVRFGEEEGGALWDRFTVHYTPVHGSWLNQAELEIGLFSKQCLGKRRLGKIRVLRAEARAWNRRTNRNRVTINWTFDRKKARKKFKYKYKTKRSWTYRQGHAARLPRLVDGRERDQHASVRRRGVLDHRDHRAAVRADRLAHPSLIVSERPVQKRASSRGLPVPIRWSRPESREG